MIENEGEAIATDATDTQSSTTTEPSAVDSPVADTPKTGRDWLGWAIFASALGAALWGLFAAVGSDWGFWPWQSGMTGVHWSALLAAVALLAGFLSLWRARKTGSRGATVLRWVGSLAAIIYLGWLSTFWFAEKSAPAIHDISTNLADPPQYRTLVLRTDNLDHIPGIDDPAMKAMNPQQRWALIHQKSYGDIRSVRINEPVAAVMAKAERLATARGWELSEFAPDEGRLEAVSETGLFGFHHDIAIRIRPTETADGSIADMRSVSRELQNDRGTNADLVRAFLADLSGTVTAAN